MRRKYLALEQYHCNHSATTITVTITTITVGVTAVSAVTPTVIVALSAHHALSPAVIDSSGVATPGPGGPVPGYQKFYKFLTLL